MGDSEPGDRCE